MDRNELNRRGVGFIGSHEFRAVLLFVALSAAFAWLAVESVSSVRAPVFSGDAAAFHSVARKPLSSSKFWAGIRPWTVPLLHKLAGRKDANVVSIQKALSIVCHIFLAGMLFYALGRRWVGLVAAGLIFLYALSPYVNGWTVVIRSESASFSLTAFVLGSLTLVLIHFGPRAKPRWHLYISGALFSLSSLLLAFCRLNWSVQLLVIASFLGLSCLRSQWRRSYPKAHVRGRILLAAFLVLLALLQFAASHKGDKWRYNFINIIFQRVLPNESVRNVWAEQYGMPLDDEIISFSGLQPNARGKRIWEIEEFQDWVGEKGLQSYSRYLLSRPYQTLLEVWRGFHSTVNDFCTEYTHESGRDTALARGVQKALFFPLPMILPELSVLFCIVAPLVVAARSEPKTAACAWATVVFAIGLPIQSFICYLGDPWEVARHNLSVTITLRLLLLISVLLFANWYFRFSAERPRRQGSTSPPGPDEAGDARVEKPQDA